MRAPRIILFGFGVDDHDEFLSPEFDAHLYIAVDYTNGTTIDGMTEEVDLDNGG